MALATLRRLLSMPGTIPLAEVEWNHYPTACLRAITGYFFFPPACSTSASSASSTTGWSARSHTSLQSRAKAESAFGSLLSSSTKPPARSCRVHLPSRVAPLDGWAPVFRNRANAVSRVSDFRVKVSMNFIVGLLLYCMSGRGKRRSIPLVLEVVAPAEDRSPWGRSVGPDQGRWRLGSHYPHSGLRHDRGIGKTSHIDGPVDPLGKRNQRFCRGGARHKLRTLLHPQVRAIVQNHQCHAGAGEPAPLRSHAVQQGEEAGGYYPTQSQACQVGVPARDVRHIGEKAIGKQ